MVDILQRTIDEQPAPTSAGKDAQKGRLVRDYAGRVGEKALSPVDGYVLYGLAGPPAKAGESVATIALPSKGTLVNGREASASICTYPRAKSDIHRMRGDHEARTSDYQEVREHAVVVVREADAEQKCSTDGERR